MKKSLLSVLTVVSLFTFGITLFGCSNSSNTEDTSAAKLLEEVDGTMKAMGTFTKALDAEGGVSKLYIYSALDSKVSTYFNAIPKNAFFRWNWNTGSNEDTTKYIEVTPKINQNNGRIYYDLRYTTELDTKKEGFFAHSIWVTKEELENIKNNNISPDLENLDQNELLTQMTALGTNVKTYENYRYTYACMFRFDTLDAKFTSKLSGKEANGSFYDGNYEGISYPYDNNYNWVELYIGTNNEGNMYYDLRVLEKGSVDGKVKCFYFPTTEGFNQFVTLK